MLFLTLAAVAVFLVAVGWAAYGAVRHGLRAMRTFGSVGSGLGRELERLDSSIADTMLRLDALPTNEQRLQVALEQLRRSQAELSFVLHHLADVRRTVRDARAIVLGK